MLITELVCKWILNNAWMNVKNKWTIFMINLNLFKYGDIIRIVFTKMEFHEF